MKHYKTAICAIIKNEHQYLDEWIKYHLSIGFNEIYLYEDFGSKSHNEITSQYSNVNLTQLSSIFDNIKNLHADKQTALYIYFYKNYRDNIDYTAFIDIDEFIMLSLRLKKGLNLTELSEKWGKELTPLQNKKLKMLEKQGYITFEDNTVSLTPKGFLMENAIACEIML
jgi:coproporphyrinogen III oxidase-like Fe-S oxidoreductase